MDTLSTLFIIILIAISAFLSSAEIALFSLSKIQLKHLRERFKPVHRTIKKLLGDPAGVLVTILVCNEIANIAISSIISSNVAGSHEYNWFREILMTRFFSIPEWGADLIIGTVLTTPIILILCEMTPKVIAARTNTLIAPLASSPLHGLYQLMMPVRKVVLWTQTFISRILPGIRGDARLISTSSKLREEDFMSMVEEAQREGTVQSSELQLIRNVFDLDDTPVIEIATPVSRVFMLPQTTTLQQALSSMKEGSAGQRYSRIPVYGKSRSDVVGLLYSKDLLVAKLEKTPPNTPISELMWKPFFISAATHLNSLFRKMKKQRIHLAVITNDAGTPIGVVTMNDVLEALLDELLIDDEEGDDV